MGRNDYNPYIGLPKDDVKAIIQFLDDLESLLDEFVEKYEKIIPRRSEFHNDFHDAWGDVKENFPISIKYLKRNENVKGKLEDEGLTGNQLKLKLSMFYFAANKIKKAEDNLETNRRNFPQRRYRWKRFWGWALELADIILGSLSAVGVPGVGAISEFKEVAEKATKEPHR